MKTKPTIKIAAAMWTLTQYPDAKHEWSPERKIREVRKAGCFDGIATHYFHPTVPFARKAGVYIVGGHDIAGVKDAAQKLRAYKEMGIMHVNCQICDHDTPTEKALPVAIRIMEIGERLGIKPAIEVHRDTCTETPEKTFALADAYHRKTGKKLRMNFDHSHPAIIKHLNPGNYWERLGVRLDLLRLGELIHFRPFNGHHCQIPITDGRGKLSPEFKDWLPFCDKVIQAWLTGSKPGRELVVVSEVGARVGGYCLSTFPDPWKDAQVLTKEIRKIWNRRVKQWR